MWPLVLAGASVLGVYLFFGIEDNRRYVIADIDKQQYLVNADKKEVQLKSANLLAEVKVRVKSFIDILFKTYLDHPPVERLRMFDANNIVETQTGTDMTAFMVNKGEQLSLCLHSKHSRNADKEDAGSNFHYNMNLLLYVVIHEMAHVMSKSIGHTNEFYDNFRFLLRVAIKENVYTPVDYMKNPTDYCGVIINESILP